MLRINNSNPLTDSLFVILDTKIAIDENIKNCQEFNSIVILLVNKIYLKKPSIDYCRSY